MDDLSLGERVAMGLAQRCAALEEERDQLASRLEAAGLEYEEAIRERDEARAALESVEGDRDEWKLLAHSREKQRDEARAVASGLRDACASLGGKVDHYEAKYPWLNEET